VIGASRTSTKVTTKTRSAVDAFVSQQLAAVTAAQATYFGTHGRYFQGLPTHAVPVAHTDAATGSTPGTLTSHPADQAEDWLTVFPSWNGLGLPASLRLDVYDGPQGKGYTWIVEATHNGVIWRRSLHVGPETYRTEPWRIVVPLFPPGS
jgi:hypothetical protein